MMDLSPVKSTSVSRSTQYDSPSHLSTSRRSTTSDKKDKLYEIPIVYDYIHPDDPNDVERLRVWCCSQWLATIRKSLFHRNLMHYHLCCNSFSRRYFCRSANHPTEETFEVNKLKDFKGMETGEDLFRWQLNMVNENAKHGIKTLFPTINSKHYDITSGHFDSPDISLKAQMTKRCVELERDLDEHKRLIGHLRTENARLLRSSKNWHSLYEETLGKREPQLDLLSTPPLKRMITNSFVFVDDN